MNNSFTYPKVLIVSHNSFSSTNNMGKLWRLIFRGFLKSVWRNYIFMKEFSSIKYL